MPGGDPACRVTCCVSRMPSSAKRCIADPGSFQTQSSRRSRTQRTTSCCAAPGKQSSLHRHPLLQALTGIDLAGIEIAARVELADVHPVEFAGLAARPAERADHSAVAA